jgi:PAS domain S-box-containing protein
MPDGGRGAQLPARLRVLHLEDDAADAELVHAALEAEGTSLEVQRVETREGFLSAFASGGFDLILSDYALPAFDGISAVREVRRRGSDIPMILVSGTLGEERAVEALKAGATDFVVKQHLSRLGPAVARALEEAQERAALRRMEAELAESRRFLQRVIDASPNLIYVFDLLERRSTYVNPQSAAMLGYTPEEIVDAGNHLVERIPVHPADWPALSALWERMRSARDGEVVESDYRVRVASGEWRWLRSRRVPFKRAGAEVRQILGAAEDVTDHKRAGQRRAAQYELTAVLSEAGGWPEAAGEVARALGSTLEWSLAEVWTMDPAAHALRLAALWHDPALDARRWTEASSTLAFGPGSSLPGRVWASPRARWVEQVEADDVYARRALAAELGIRSAAAAPIRTERDVFGVIVLLNRDASRRDPEQLEALETFGREVGGFCQRRATERALRDSEEKYRSIVETTAEWIWASDAAGRLTYSNPGVRSILGYAPEELTGRATFELLEPSSAEWMRANLPQFRAERKGWRGVTLRWRHRDGSARYLESDAAPILDAGGAVVGFRGSDRDVTERVLAEERVREQAALLEAARDAILVEALDGTVTYWNRGAERIYGVSSAEVSGRLLSDFLFAGGAAELREARRAVLERGEWSGQLSQRTRDGRELVIQSHWTLLRDHGAAPRSVLVINSDVTEARRLEAKFLRAQRMDSLGVLAGGIAHDLNNILAPILMAVDVLRRKELDEQARRLMAAVETSARRGADLARQVLTFARGAEGNRVPLQLRHLIGEMERMARETFPRSIEVRTDIARDLWTVMGQTTPLQQVLMNLSVNARDAMPEGGVLSLSAENVTLGEPSQKVHPLAHPGPYVHVAVADTGAGIAPDVLDRIFDPFFTTKPVGRGTGLGLSTSLSIVSGHGGFINVESEPGRGATFHVYLPALPASVAAGEEPPAAEPESGAGELVLLVDDESSIREMAREVLEEFGFRVITAGGGRDAIALFRERRGEVRVIVTDLNMPEMDGTALIRAVREMSPGVAIVASSGMIDGDDSQTGADAVVPKPYTAAQLVEAVRQAAHGRG